jgi:O-antigen ligase
MGKLTNTFLCLALLVAGLMGLTLSLPLQAPALIMLGVSGLVGLALVLGRQYDLRLMILVMLALAYFLIRAWMSPVVDLANEDLFLIIAAGLFYLLAGPVNGMPSARISIAGIVLLLLCVHLGSALIQLLGGEGYSIVWLFTNGTTPEGSVISGMYGYRGSFANFAIISGMLALCLGVWGRFAVGIRVVLVVLGGVALAAACYANSRSAMISLGAGGLTLLVMLWMSSAYQQGGLRKKFRTVIVASGGVGVLLAIIATVLIFQNRAQNGVHGSEVMFDSNVRLAFWPMALEQFVDHPLTGAGSRSFSYECFYYWSPNLDTGEANPEFVHNEYLQALADYGLIGLILILSLLGMHFFIGLRRIQHLSKRLQSDGIKQGSNAMALSIAGIVGIVVMSVHVVFDFRTHLLANLLILVCCLIWVLPDIKQGGKGGRLGQLFVLSMLLVLSSCAIWMGATQFRGGIPLLKNGMAKEHGTWSPATVDRSSWIPSLEKAIDVAPSYRRHLRLGTLYRLEAESAKGDEKVEFLHRAIEQYERAADRHVFEPVSQINLASLHTYLKEYEKADAYFVKSDQLASSRERWFRIHTKWADMQRQWAGSLWQASDTVSAELHYLRALEILKQGKVQSRDTTMMYLMIVIEYTRMLDDSHDYESADKIFEKAENNQPIYVINSLKLNIRREMGNHYLRKGKYLW